MLPSRRYNGQYGLTDFFNDFFENKTLERAEFTTPAINVAENETEYHLEVAAPGACKDDFKVHLNRDGNLVIEMEKKECGCKDKEKEKKECKYLRKEFSYTQFQQNLILLLQVHQLHRILKCKRYWKTQVSQLHISM